MVSSWCRRRNHRDDDVFGSGRRVIEQLVVGPDFALTFAMYPRHARKRVVIGIGGFSGLEEDIGVLGAAAQYGCSG